MLLCICQMCWSQYKAIDGFILYTASNNKGNTQRTHPRSWWIKYSIWKSLFIINYHKNMLMENKNTKRRSGFKIILKNVEKITIWFNFWHMTTTWQWGKTMRLTRACGLHVPVCTPYNVWACSWWNKGGSPVVNLIQGRGTGRPMPSSCRNCWHTPATWSRALSCIRRNPGPTAPAYGLIMISSSNHGG